MEGNQAAQGQLGHTAQHDVRKNVRRPTGTPRLLRNLLCCQLSCAALTRVSRCLFCRLTAWGRSGGAVSWLCLSQRIPEPTLSTGVSATVVNMLNRKLRMCIVLGVCVLWRRPSRAAMVWLILSRGRCARPPADTDCWDRQIRRQPMVAACKATYVIATKRPSYIYISSVVQLSS